VQFGLKTIPRRHPAISRTATTGAVVILTLAPALRLLRILATTGADTPSSDDGVLIPRFLGQVLAGGYNWLRFPEDTFRNSHSHLTTALTYIVMAHWGHFNVYGALYFGVLLAGAKLVLLCDAFTYRLRDRAGLRGLLLWPLLSALVFSVAQMSVFEHGLQTLMTGFSQLGLAVGVWALVRFPGRWLGVVIVVIAALLASFSFASGLALWPLFGFGMAAFRFKKVGQYCLFIAGGALAIGSYYYFMHVDPATVGGSNTIFRPFSFDFLTDTLGRPFVSNLTDLIPTAPAARLIGCIGLVLAVLTIAVIARADKRALADARPALLMIASGVLVIWQISLTRFLTAPWYSAFALDFWIGLIGLAYICWSSPLVSASVKEASGKLARTLSPYWGVAITVLVLFFWAQANRAWSNKSFFLRTRAPVSAATLRNYRTAPTYSEGTLVVWPMGNPLYASVLAQPFERYHLSVFAPHQEWSLQGDSILDTVEYHQPQGQPTIFWSEDSVPTKTKFTSYRHLNAVIPTAAWISWKVTIPATLEHADFTSAISIADSAPKDGSLNHVDFKIYIQGTGGTEKEALSARLDGTNRGWHAISIPLNEYKGQTITLRIASSSAGVSGNWALYRFPVIDVDAHEPSDESKPPGPITPSNTDLYPGFQQPAPEDFQLSTADADLWKATQLEPVIGEPDIQGRWRVTGAFPSLEYRGALGLTAADYCRFYIKIAASADMAPRLVTVYCKTSGESGFGVHQFSIPLLPNTEELHTYTFDLRLADDLDGAELTGLKIAFLEPRWIAPVVTPRSWLHIDSVGFIRLKSPPEILGGD
jgi:hypothetical protein